MNMGGASSSRISLDEPLSNENMGGASSSRISLDEPLSNENISSRISLDEPLSNENPEPRNQPRPHIHRSESSNAMMRQDMAPWGSIYPTPPNCRAVGESKWRRFSTTLANSKSSDKMRASVLLEEHGTTPDFNPPILERCDLRVPDPEVAGSIPIPQPAIRRSSSGVYIAMPHRTRPRYQPFQINRSSSNSSWTTVASESAEPGAIEPIVFEKQLLRPASTNSLLTAGIKTPPKPKKMMSMKETMENIKKECGMKKLCINDLPEDAFETDSEDED